MILNVHSIFTSISGEVGLFPQGSTCAFIRLAGCNLKCDYCDTPHTQSPKSGKKTSTVEVVRVVLDSGIKQVLITGGEPLVQMKPLAELVDYLASNGLVIQIETNGTIKPEFDGVDCWVCDRKLPGSRCMSKELSVLNSPNWLDSDDYLKLVCHGPVDLGAAVDIITAVRRRPKPLRPQLALGTTGSLWPPSYLYERMRELGLTEDVLLNVQLHKIIGLE